MLWETVMAIWQTIADWIIMSGGVVFSEFAFKEAVGKFFFFGADTPEKRGILSAD